MAKKESKATAKKQKNNKDKTSFFKGFKAEIKKVNWPTPKQLVNNTLAVVVIVLLLSVIVFVLDLTFESVNKYGIDRIKEAVVSSNSSEENDGEDTAIDETNAQEENTQNDETTNENSETNSNETEQPAQ